MTRPESVMTGQGTALALPSRGYLLSQAREALAHAGVESPGPEAEMLLLHALGISRTRLWSDRAAPVQDEEAARFARLLTARASRVPLQHLLGEMPFHAAELEIEPGVFIPRPETERLVEVVLEELDHDPDDTASGGKLVDLGTGTGAIPIALLLSLPEGWTAAAIDRSEKAVALARRNARRNGVDGRLRLEVADFRQAPPARIQAPADVLVSNPPYIPTHAIPRLMPEVRDHDPREALDGGPDGLDAFRAIAETLGAWLKRGGILALEIGADQADPCMELFGPLLVGARVARDLAGMPRILTGRRGTR
jgi:release factor glutamine methyltransferase